MSLTWKNKPFALLMSGLLLATSTVPSFAASVGELLITVPTANSATADDNEEELEEREPPLFVDIEGHWAEETIVAMCGLGLFTGIDEEHFAPDQNMTRAEFLVVIIRSMYPTADENVVDGTYWYSPFFDIAYVEGILPSTWREKYLDEYINRQEMAFIISKALDADHQYTEQLINTNTIPDYSLVSKTSTDDYQAAVVNVYSQGIMGGKTEEGEFFPQDYGTRAECATVLLNYVDVAYRPEVEFEPDPDALTDLNRLDADFTRKRNNLTFSYDDPYRPIAKVGDKIIIGNEEYEVVAHPSGAVHNNLYIPYIQGIALDLGIDTNSVHGIVEHGFSGGGIHYGGEPYYVNPVTGEGYWLPQWDAILKRNISPSKAGVYEGDVSDNQQWIWSVAQHKWIEAYLYEAPL